MVLRVMLFQRRRLVPPAPAISLKHGKHHANTTDREQRDKATASSRIAHASIRNLKKKEAKHPKWTALFHTSITTDTTAGANSRFQEPLTSLRVPASQSASHVWQCFGSLFKYPIL